ncbi:DUF2064 domain-containing protein [Clostridiaceae bacterium 68-1-5]|uniref:DUF2064 domain-containing protein n=1 Tax=Suipraeoptans intestinalis TaxID=2606628 RepID=A0A6N7URI3_9FIRM|nr:TIGR04283 family arsenosugar biosynthesis glycosyltransferase [Suipraeoptans intestinalis]MSR92914.1 DUF2064 domain-containing protein [Suipraeoptans intestinalis]
MKRAVILFTRAPVPGKTKTRMMPRLSPEECSLLHKMFLLDIQRTLRGIDADIYVFHASDTAQEEQLLKQLWEEKAAEEPFLKENSFGQPWSKQLKGFFPQKGETLGVRMFQSICQVLEAGYESCVLIGTDVPELSREDLEAAFERLLDQDVVFGRTKDGGYYLIGMKQPVREAFELSSYGHSAVLEQTVSRIEEAGFSVGFTGTREDMDVFEDLLGYLQRARSSKRLPTQYTFFYVLGLLRISVIIPIYQEEDTIRKMKRQLEEIQATKEAFHEIIFVDGGSKDATLSLLGEEYPVLHCSKSRSLQMNLGAKESTGDILFFLHCDSLLPPFPKREILEVIAQNPVGCFGIRFPSRNILMHICSRLSNFRAEKRGLPFGDQGIFLERSLFFELGMFPELPIMEDYQFSLTLRAQKIPVRLTPHRLVTSGRRFPKGIIPKLLLMWKMYRLRAWYRQGVSVKKLADLYGDVR